MTSQHSSHPPHRLDTAAQSPSGPDVQKSAGPSDGPIPPQILEGFFKHPGSAGGQLAAQQPPKSLLGPATHPIASAQQLPAHVLELLGHRPASQAAALGSAHL